MHYLLPVGGYIFHCVPSSHVWTQDCIQRCPSGRVQHANNSKVWVLHVSERKKKTQQKIITESNTWMLMLSLCLWVKISGLHCIFSVGTFSPLMMIHLCVVQVPFPWTMWHNTASSLGATWVRGYSLTEYTAVSEYLFTFNLMQYKTATFYYIFFSKSLP